MIRPILAFTATALTLSALAMPALAQTAGGTPKKERLIQIREGERCPRGTDDEVIVCYQDRPDEIYRIPERFREPLASDATTNTERVAQAEAATDTGTMSCSDVGPGGFTGCHNSELRGWAEQRRRQQAARERAVDD